VLIAIGALFVVATLLKGGPATPSDPADSAVVPPEERERIHQFWETYREATEHRVQERFPEAAQAYRQALALDPEHLDALYYLGNVEFDLGNLAAAERAWRRLIELDPTSSRAHSQLGALYFCTGEERMLQPDRAAAEFQRAAAINREETGPLLSLGEIALVRGQLGDARSYFDAVIGSNYTSVEAHFYQGYLAWISGAPARAAELLAAAAALARPAAAADAVAGEGDTRDGTAPMVRAPVRCGALRSRVDVLVALDDAVAGNAQPVYQAFDESLRNIRRNLPQ
jgi:tetratricopeptide (TPR) repeat protein